MKTLKATILFFSILGLFWLTSCSKDRLEKDVNTEYAPLGDFYNTYAPHEQEFIIDSLGDDTIIGEHGTMIWDVPGTKFMDKITYQDIYYPYTLKLIEAYSMKDMIMSQLSNAAQGWPLKTAGEIKITAFKNNNELALKEHCGVYYFAPTTSPDTAISMFYGFTNGTLNDWNADVLQTDYLFSSDDVTQVVDQYGGYEARMAKLGWTSLNHFYSYSDTTDIYFTAAGTNPNNIDIYLIFNNIHSFMKVDYMTLHHMPVGASVKVFAIGKSTDGTMYYHLQNYTVTSGMVVELEMQPSTETEVLTLMDAL